MLTLIFVVCGLLAFFCAVKGKEDASFSYCIVASFCFFGICASIVGLYNVSQLVPAKIAMYEEENAEIEAKIENTVEKYMEYEQGIMIEIAPNEDCMTLVSLYPELNADTLVAEEIKVYIRNNDQIRELKEKQLKKQLYKFMLFFGN